jgi:hypothetical protein
VAEGLQQVKEVRLRSNDKVRMHVALLTLRCMNMACLAMPCDASQVLLLLLLSLYSRV